VRRTVAALALIAAVLATTTSCTSKGGNAPSSSDVTVTSTRTLTRTPSAAPFTPQPATTVAPLPPGAAPAAGEVEKACPYIASTPNDDPNTNVADIEGDHVYRTTVLTKLKPVGCRFYFYAGPFEAIADFIPRTFATAAEAHNAMVLTAGKGTQQIAQPNMIKGVDAILFRTRFFSPDGNQDWACAFAKGKVMVIVHTQRKDTSQNALYLAQAVVAKF
jgi:hypothetical protein